MSCLQCTNEHRSLSRHRRRKQHAKRQIDDVIGEVYLRLAQDTESCKAFHDILTRVQDLTDLIRPTPELCRWSDACLYVQALENLALHYRDFIRPLRTWRPRA